MEKVTTKRLSLFTGRTHPALAQEVADHLGITQRTVEFHRANIFDKMGVSSAIELAHKLGRLQPIVKPQA